MCEITTTNASTYSLCRLGESVLYIAYCLADRKVGGNLNICVSLYKLGYVLRIFVFFFFFFFFLSWSENSHNPEA